MYKTLLNILFFVIILFYKLANKKKIIQWIFVVLKLRKDFLVVDL